MGERGGREPCSARSIPIVCADSNGDRVEATWTTGDHLQRSVSTRSGINRSPSRRWRSHEIRRRPAISTHHFGGDAGVRNGWSLRHRQGIKSGRGANHQFGAPLVRPRG